MRAVDLITKKRDGGTHTDHEIAFLVHGYTRGLIPDYQMSAWLMAVNWRGLTDAETFALTHAMVETGDVLDLSSLPGVPVDKHSTGGVGDKTTLAVVPILASAGVPVAKMSGRGLGHTGGTLDKMESIPGVRVHLSVPEILAQVRSVGACICAQTENLVPADKKIYALRDATGTVTSLPLIAASVMSKKIAGGSRAVLLDVKVGGGAFMKTREDARALARLMIKIGEANRQRVVAVLSDMDQPLGSHVGNVVEVAEVVRLLSGDPGVEPRLRELVRYLAAVGLMLGDRAARVEEGLDLADRQLASGAALDKFREIVSAHGGDAAALAPAAEDAAARMAVRAARPGVVSRIDAAAIGLAAMHLGAGRSAKEQEIDPLAGVVLRCSVGARVGAGDTLALLCACEDRGVSTAAALVKDAITIADAAPDPQPLIHETLGLQS